MTHRFIYIAIVLLLQLACKESHDTSVSEFDTLDGTYQSIGYWRLLHIANDTLTLMDIQDRFCKRMYEYLFSELGENLTLDNDTLTFKIGYDRYQYTRISWEPAICHITYTKEQMQDPMLNFDILAQTFKTHYAFLELNDLDWESIYQAHHQKITEKTTEVELYQIMESFITAMNDQHGNLDVPEVILDQLPEMLSQETIKVYGDFEVASILRKQILEKELSKNSAVIRWGLLSEQIGYIQINAMMLTAQFELETGALEEHGWAGAYYQQMDTHHFDHSNSM